MPDFLIGWEAAIVAFILAQIADIFTTTRGLNAGARERNPVVAWLMRRLDRRGWVIAKVAIETGAAMVIINYGAFWMLWLVAALTFAVAAHNLKFAK